MDGSTYLPPKKAQNAGAQLSSAQSLGCSCRFRALNTAHAGKLPLETCVTLSGAEYLGSQSKRPTWLRLDPLAEYIYLFIY